MGVSDTPEQREIARGTATRLHQLMVQRHVTAATMSYDMRVNAGLVSRWLKGETMMSAKYIVSVCEYFNVSSDWLLGLSDTPHPAPSRARTESEIDASADVLEQTTPPRARPTRPKRKGN